MGPSKEQLCAPCLRSPITEHQVVNTQSKLFICEGNTLEAMLKLAQRRLAYIFLKLCWLPENLARVWITLVLPLRIFYVLKLNFCIYYSFVVTWEYWPLCRTDLIKHPQKLSLKAGIGKPMHNSMRYKPNITEPIYNGFKGLLIDSTNRLHVIVLAQTIRDNPN